MKATKLLSSTLIALASVAGSAAFAQSYSPTQSGVPTTNERSNPVEVTTGGEKSRAEVRAELAQAEASGAFDNPSERLTFMFDNTTSSKSRADVRAEVLQAKSSGAMAVPGTARTPFGTTTNTGRRS